MGGAGGRTYSSFSSPVVAGSPRGYPAKLPAVGSATTGSRTLTVTSSQNLSSPIRKVKELKTI